MRAMEIIPPNIRRQFASHAVHIEGYKNLSQPFTLECPEEAFYQGDASISADRSISQGNTPAFAPFPEHL